MNGQGGPRTERPDVTGSRDTRVRSATDPRGLSTLIGQGPLQPRPAQDVIGKPTVVVAPRMDEAREQALEALRQQKIPPHQLGTVSEFYKNLAPQQEPPK
jgi:hypothetical protein